MPPCARTEDGRAAVGVRCVGLGRAVGRGEGRSNGVQIATSSCFVKRHDCVTRHLCAIRRAVGWVLDGKKTDRIGAQDAAGGD